MLLLVPEFLHSFQEPFSLFPGRHGFRRVLSNPNRATAFGTHCSEPYGREGRGHLDSRFFGVVRIVVSHIWSGIASWFPGFRTEGAGKILLDNRLALV